MYSMVLATVLATGGTSTPGWVIHGGCHGGCTGPVVNGYLYNTGCYGSRYGTGYGSGYNTGVFGGCCGGYSACFGGNYGFNAPYYNTYGAYGAGVYCIGCAGGVSYPTPPAVPIPPRKKEKESRGEKEMQTRPTQATVIVQIPENAKLDVDGHTANLTSETRTFVTPDLLPGRTYFYTITAELVRDGRVMTRSEKVFVRAGETSRVDFGEMAGTSARR